MAPGDATGAGDRAELDRVAVDRAIRSAEQSSRCEFSVFVGHSDGVPRDFAQRLHARLVAPARSVLVMVDPARRAVEVITGEDVRRNLTDSEVSLAVSSMTQDFSGGDLTAGLVRGIRQLAEHARAPRTLHA